MKKLLAAPLVITIIAMSGLKASAQVEPRFAGDWQLKPTADQPARTLHIDGSGRYHVTMNGKIVENGILTANDGSFKMKSDSGSSENGSFSILGGELKMHNSSLEGLWTRPGATGTSASHANPHYVPGSSIGSYKPPSHIAPENTSAQESWSPPPSYTPPTPSRTMPDRDYRQSRDRESRQSDRESRDREYRQSADRESRDRDYRQSEPEEDRDLARARAAFGNFKDPGYEHSAGRMNSSPPPGYRPPNYHAHEAPGTPENFGRGESSYDAARRTPGAYLSPIWGSAPSTKWTPEESHSVHNSPSSSSPAYSKSDVPEYQYPSEQRKIDFETNDRWQQQFRGMRGPRPVPRGGYIPVMKDNKARRFFGGF